MVWCKVEACMSRLLALQKASVVMWLVIASFAALPLLDLSCASTGSVKQTETSPVLL